MVMDLEYYLLKGSVRKTFVDRNRAQSLVRIAKERIQVARYIENPNVKLELAYESVIEGIEALMALRGFKSYSHEANIAFLKTVGFRQDEIEKLDNIRKLRHKSKYYGEEIKNEVAKDAFDFCEHIPKKILKLVKT